MVSATPPPPPSDRRLSHALIARELYTGRIHRHLSNRIVGIRALGFSLMLLGGLHSLFRQLPGHWLTWCIWVVSAATSSGLLAVTVLVWKDYAQRLMVNRHPEWVPGEEWNK